MEPLENPRPEDSADPDPAGGEETLTDLGRLRPQPRQHFHRLDSRVRFLWFIGRAIFWCVFFLGVLALGLFKVLLGSGVPASLMGLLAVVVCLALWHLSWPLVSYRHWGYRVRDTDFLVRSGVLWKRLRAVPFARIQHVDSDSGPLERAFGMANLVVHTAGSQSGTVRVPGLQLERAEQLRDYLSKVGHTHANL